MNVAFWCSGTGQVWTWRYTPFLGVWALAATFIGGYVLTHRRAGVPLDRARTRNWCLGVLALFVVSEWPIGQIGAGYLATVGIARYVVYTFIAAPLLLSGLPTWLIDRWLPFGSRREQVVTMLTRWPVALVIFNAVLFGSHLPVVIDGLKTTQIGSFGIDVFHLGAALIWWWPAIRRERERNAIQEPVRAFYLFASSVMMFVPAGFLTFSPLPLYGLYELAPPLWLGFDAVADQQAAGIMMNVVGGLVLWAIIAALFLRWAKEQHDEDAAVRRAANAGRLAAARAAAATTPDIATPDIATPDIATPDVTEAEPAPRPTDRG